MTKQEETRKGLYLLRFAGPYGKSYKLSYPDVDEILSYLHSQGVVIKVDRELTQLPENPSLGDMLIYKTQQDMLKAGYVAVEPLIKGAE